MAGGRMTVLAFAPYQWRSQWRDLRQRGAWRGANVSTVIVVGALGLWGQIALCALAVVSLAKGEAFAGAALAEAGLMGVLLGWLVLPILVSSIAGGGPGVTVQRLVQFPLSSLQLFLVGALGSLLQPVYWVLVLASLVSLVPLALMPRPFAGMAAGLVYVAAAAVVSWGVGLFASAVSSSRRGREIALTVVAILVFGIIPLSFGHLSHADGVFRYRWLDREFLILDLEARQGLLVVVSDWMPAALVGGCARGEQVAVRFAMLVIALMAGLGLSVLSLRRLLRHPAEGLGGTRTRRRGIAAPPGLPPALGVVTVKELRYLRRTLDALLGFAFGAIAALWILLRPGDANKVLVLCLPVIALNEMVMPLNVFGLDGPAVDRYRLLPLSGRQVLLSKNLAFLGLVLAEITAPLVAGLWRLGAPFTLAAACAGLSACLLMIVWGNRTSIHAPARREFFNFDSKEQAGGILSMLGVVALWLIPFAVGLAARRGGAGALLVGELALLLAAAGVYALALPAAGRAFESRAEEMRARL